MGDYAITVQCTGPHGNDGHPDDAEVLGAEFVRQLVAHGHTVHDARLTQTFVHQVDLKVEASKPVTVWMSPSDAVSEVEEEEDGG